MPFDFIRNLWRSCKTSDDPTAHPAVGWECCHKYWDKTGSHIVKSPLSQVYSLEVDFISSATENIGEGHLDVR